MPVLDNTVTVPVRLKPAIYRTLRAIADAKGCQVHHLLEHLAAGATRNTPRDPATRATAATSINVRRLHAAGHCDRVIAERLGITVHLVIQHRRRLGLRVNPDPDHPAIQITPEYTARVLELARAGIPDTDIATQVGGSRETIRKLRCEAGIKRHPGRPSKGTK
ncbi:hypothetical protein F8O06_02805 [Pseudoclavibacter sp. CFCC 14310]|uniref:hypothetical protein n=1 Tax=Pseudoclavibacter sp. CFCC 14310 TaxID=2615180 RepID=UPI00130109EB|nr:hypothetical protein [Pseudoclavibacter sp. CFCC 14310]KAB1647487.1 hypothetical protein F8O06_02805 [Pseudoclavibacter sp. CFCC 14310]